MHLDPQIGRTILDSVYGGLFFGVPNQGMTVESLIPMVWGQPNRFLLDTLSKDSPVLRAQCRDFLRAFSFQGSLEITCFYETMQSPTAVFVRRNIYCFSFMDMDRPTDQYLGRIGLVYEWQRSHCCRQILSNA